ncbi:MAG: YncE family protein [Pyrinomonadaceae bacterium]
MQPKVSLFVVIVLYAIGPACASAQQSDLPFRQLQDVPLTGKSSRLDYQSFDEQSGRLYIAHLGDSMMTVFDTRTQKVVGDVRDLKHVHGVLAVPELHRIYASATGTNELVVIDDQTLQITARVPAGEYPDGIAYARRQKKIYVSDKTGRTETVIDATTNKVVTAITLGGQVGNSQYDSVADRILVAVHGINQIVEIDPNTDKITANYPLPGCKDSHGLLIDDEDRLAFAACEANAKLAVVDLSKKEMTTLFPVGGDPDVLAFDPGLARLYVSAESGIVMIFQVRDRWPVNIAGGFFASNAHTVAVDGSTHRIYFPLENVGGKPVLRIVLPADKQQ